MAENRSCKVCKLFLPLNEQNFRICKNPKSGGPKSEKTGFSRTCRRCRNEETLRHSQTPEQKIRFRKSHLKKTYNLTLEQYEKMFDDQKGVCYLCGHTCKTKKLLSVDHSHKVEGKVRKLLCQQCNISLGSFNDDIDLMLKAIQYLRDHEVA